MTLLFLFLKVNIVEMVYIFHFHINTNTMYYYKNTLIREMSRGQFITKDQIKSYLNLKYLLWGSFPLDFLIYCFHARNI